MYDAGGEFASISLPPPTCPLLEKSVEFAYIRIMKKLSLLSILVLVLTLQACKKSEEQLRVESVVGEYDCYASCSTTNLVTQDPPTTELDTAILYVTRPYDDENGYIAMMGQEVYLEKDLSFRKGVTNYSLMGEFDGAGGLTFSIDYIDTDAQTRSQCSYVCQKR